MQSAVKSALRKPFEIERMDKIWIESLLVKVLSVHLHEYSDLSIKLSLSLLFALLAFTLHFSNSWVWVVLDFLNDAIVLGFF